MRITCTLSLLLLLQWVNAQHDHTCGTESSDKFLELLYEHRDELADYRMLPTRSFKEYPTRVHIIRRADGTGGMTLAELDLVMQQLNSQLAPAGIAVAYCDSITFINSDLYYDFNKIQESSLTNQYSTSNTINLYFPNSVTTPAGTPLCGYAYFPGWQDVVVVDRYCALDGSSLAHEFGHYFGLIHTHGITNAAMTDELVNFSNCITAGDDVCDTPAEPNLEGVVDSNCIYTGDEVDGMGVAFDPYPFNIMSYAPKPCRMQLTTGQYTRMSFVANYLRDYLTCPVLSAEFSVSGSVAFCADTLSAVLTYDGVGATGFAWDVNADGVADYDSCVVSHTFQGSGSHAVCLVVWNDTDTITNCVNDAVIISTVQSLPYYESFDDTVSGAMLNPDAHYGWQIGNLSPNYNGYSLLIDNYHYNASGEEDYFVIGPFDMQSVDVPVLLFDCAYAPFDDDRLDELRVEVSTDCGATYTTLSAASGLSLSSIGSYMPYQWMPADTQDWQTEQISLAAYAFDTVLIRFTNVTDFGNNLYIDNIKVQQDPLLAFEFMQFEIHANRQGHHVLMWETADEAHVVRYEVYISHDGQYFNILDQVAASNGVRSVYTFVNSVAPPAAFYRITALLSDGKLTHSPIRQIKSEQQRTAVYPNPVREILHIDPDLAPGIVSLSILDAGGRTLDVVEVRQRMGVYPIRVGHLPAGVYTLVGDGINARFLKLD